MTIRLSTGLQDLLLGAVPTSTIAATKVAFDDTGNTITRSDASGDFLADGMRPGDTILVADSDSHDDHYVIVSVTATVITVVSITVAADASNSAEVTITSEKKNVKQAFRNCVIELYSGTVPDTADATEDTGQLLGIFTEDGNAFVAGVATNGINFLTPSGGYLSIDTDTYKMTGLAEAAATFARIYDNAQEKGASTTSKRIQCSVTVGGAELAMSDTAITVGKIVFLNTFKFEIPLV